MLFGARLRKRTRALGSARHLQTAVLSLLLVALPAAGEIIERVIVKVNGDIVTLSEFEARQLAAVQAARVDEHRVEAYLRENNARILQEAIDDLLLAQRADELGMHLPAAYLKEVIDGIKKDNNITTDEELLEQLKREGMSLDDLKRNIERSVLRREVLRRELESKVTVSEAEARADYDAHKADYVRPPTVHLQEVVIRSQDASATALARDIVRRARGGEDFAALARTYSQVPSRASGGDLGELRRGELTPDLEKIVFALPKGGVSEPLRTNEGFRILHVSDKSEGSVVPFEEAKAEIVKRLTQDRTGKAYEEYMEGLRKAAMIQVQVREVPLRITGSASAPTLAAPGAAPGAAAVAPAAPPQPAGEAPELITTPQAKPERVAPPAPVTARPSPSPSPK
jgi:peptidyl-prolyl cis-trans isomerase SurA